MGNLTEEIIKITLLYLKTLGGVKDEWYDQTSRMERNLCKSIRSKIITRRSEIYGNQRRTGNVGCH